MLFMNSMENGFLFVCLMILCLLCLSSEREPSLLTVPQRSLFMSPLNSFACFVLFFFTFKIFP